MMRGQSVIRLKRVDGDRLQHSSAKKESAQDRSEAKNRVGAREKV